MHALFHPRAEALVGTSGDATKHRGVVLTDMRGTGFRGGIHGISRRLTAVDGIKCFPGLASPPRPVDTAFRAIPAEAAVQAEPSRRRQGCGIRRC
jgi:acyl-CoA synthetase (NDP forming)